MRTLKDLQLTFLEETVAHYNINNKAYDSDGCTYSSIDDISKGCAIGRHIRDKTLCKRLDKIGGVGKHNVFKLLPKKLQKLGQKFLRKIQSLHDNEYNWSAIGLSYHGKTQVKLIKKEFNLITKN